MARFSIPCFPELGADQGWFQQALGRRHVILNEVGAQRDSSVDRTVHLDSQERGESHRREYGQAACADNGKPAKLTANGHQAISLRVETATLLRLKPVQGRR